MASSWELSATDVYAGRNSQCRSRLDRHANRPFLQASVFGSVIVTTPLSNRASALLASAYSGEASSAAACDLQVAHRERHAVLPDSSLTTSGRSRGSDLDDHGDGEQRWCEKHQPRQGNAYVHGPLPAGPAIAHALVRAVSGRGRRHQFGCVHRGLCWNGCLNRMVGSPPPSAIPPTLNVARDSCSSNRAKGVCHGGFQGRHLPEHLAVSAGYYTRARAPCAVRSRQTWVCRNPERWCW